MNITSTCDLKTLSELLDLSARRLQQLANEEVVIKISRGKYDLVKSVQGYIAYQNAQIPNKGNSVDVTDARTRIEEGRANLITAKASIAKMDEEEKAGKLLEFSDVKRDASSTAVIVRQSMMLIPDSMSPLLSDMTDSREIRTLLRKEITQALTDASDLIEASLDSDVFEPTSEVDA